MIFLFFGAGVSLNVVFDICIFHSMPQRVVLGKLEPLAVVLIFFNIVVVVVVVGVELVIVIAEVVLVVVVVGLP